MTPDLSDYHRRLADPNYRRTLADGCTTCGLSRPACQANAEYESRRCCDTCAHPEI